MDRQLRRRERWRRAWDQGARRTCPSGCETAACRGATAPHYLRRGRPSSDPRARGRPTLERSPAESSDARRGRIRTPSAISAPVGSVWTLTRLRIPVAVLAGRDGSARLGALVAVTTPRRQRRPEATSHAAQHVRVAALVFAKQPDALQRTERHRMQLSPRAPIAAPSETHGGPRFRVRDSGARSWRPTPPCVRPRLPYRCRPAWIGSAAACARPSRSKRAAHTGVDGVREAYSPFCGARADRATSAGASRLAPRPTPWWPRSRRCRPTAPRRSAASRPSCAPSSGVRRC